MSARRILVPAGRARRRSVRFVFVLLALAALLVLCAPAQAYLPPGSGWESMDQQPYSFLRGVAFSDATHGWAVGQDYDASATPSELGAIVATSDGATTWTGQASGTTAILMAVATTDALHAWAVGLDGAIVATSDGHTWSPQLSATTQDLSSVAFPDASHGWAVGDGGVIRVTSNGGAVWGGQVSGTTADIMCVAFPEGDAAHGWVVARDDSTGTSRIIATDNGGGDWAEQLAVAGEITSISFPDALRGWAVTFNGVLYSTSDGGHTWGHRAMTDSENHPGGVVFVDATHGWVVGGTETEPWGTYIWATADGGLNWTLQNKGGGPERGMDAVAFPDLLHGYVVGESGSVMRTSTGGKPPVTLKLSGLRSGSLRLGRRVTASGKVPPPHEAGDRVTVTVQRKRGGRWVAAGSSARSQTLAGAYEWKYRPAATGSYRMRARVRAAAGHPAARTTWKNFSVR